MQKIFRVIGSLRLLFMGLRRIERKATSLIWKINQRVRGSVRMRVSISWWLLQLTVIILAIWRITVNRVLKISWVNCDKKRAQIQRGRSRNTEQILAVKFPKSCGDDRCGNYAMTWIWKHPRSYFHSYKFHISYV